MTNFKSCIKNTALTLTAALAALALAGPVSAQTVTDTIPVSGGVVGMAVDSTRGVVYVANNSANTVSAINEATNTVVATIPVGHFPYAVALDSSKGLVYVTNYSGASVSVIDETTNTVAATIAGVGGHSIAVDPGRGRVYAQSGSTIEVIDESTNTIITTFTAPAWAGGVAVDPVSGAIYVAGDTGAATNSVFVFDPTTFALTATIAGLPAEQLAWMAVDPVGRNLYVPGSIAYNESAVGAVFVINMDTNTLTSTIAGTQNTLWGPAFNPATGTLYVASTDYDTYVGGVMVINTATDKVTDVLPLNHAFAAAVDPTSGAVYVDGNGAVSVLSAATPTFPSIPVSNNWATGIAADSSRGVLYVANSSVNTVSAIDEATNTVLADITVEGYPYAVALDPVQGLVFVTGDTGGSMSVISEATNAVIATITGLGSDGHGIAVDPIRGRVYVQNGSTITVINETTYAIITTFSVPIWSGGIAVDPVSGTIYVASDSGSTNSVFVINPTTFALTATIAGLPAQQLAWMAVDPIGRKLYVPGSIAYNESAVGAVFVIDMTTNTLTNTIAGTQNTLWGPAFNPVTRTLYVASTDYDSYAGGVMVIDTVTDKVIDVIPLNYAYGAAVDPILGNVYVDGRVNGNGTVWVIPAGTTTPSDVSTQTGVTSTGFLYSRVTKLYSGSVTVTNNGAALTGPVSLALNNLPAGVSLADASGFYSAPIIAPSVIGPAAAGAPVIAASSTGLATGASVTIPVWFSNPSNALITFTSATLEQ